MELKKLNQEELKKMIAETAIYLKNKKEIAEKAFGLEKELISLEENFMSKSFGFGFKTDDDLSSKTKTGFKNDLEPLSMLSNLGKEIQNEYQELSEVDKLKLEIEQLKKENEKLKNK